MPSPIRRIEWVHPSLSFTPLQSAAVLFLLGVFRRLTPSLGLRSLFASSTGRVLRRIPNPTPNIHSVSHALDVCAACLVGLFHPTPAFRVHSTGYHLQHSGFASSAIHALSSFGDPALQSCDCATLGRPALRAFFRAGVQASAAGFSHGITRSPHELLLLQVFSLDALTLLSQDLPLVGFWSVVRLIAAPFSVQAPSMACLFRDCLPAQGL